MAGKRWHDPAYFTMSLNSDFGRQPRHTGICCSGSTHARKLMLRDTERARDPSLVSLATRVRIAVPWFPPNARFPPNRQTAKPPNQGGRTMTIAAILKHKGHSVITID